MFAAPFVGSSSKGRLAVGLKLPSVTQSRTQNPDLPNSIAFPKPSEEKKPDATGPMRRPERKWKRRASVTLRLTGRSVMAMGIHKGKKLADVPFGYLKRFTSTKSKTEHIENYKQALRRYLGNSAA